jgi:hypothetical protein
LSRTLVLKNVFLGLAAAFFVIGGVISLIVSILVFPIFSIYPFVVVPFGFAFAVVFVVGLICSLVAIHCYSLTAKRLVPQAGTRGMISGAILLTLSLGPNRDYTRANHSDRHNQRDNHPHRRSDLFRLAIVKSA